MSQILEKIRELRLEKDINLWSYVCLKGAYAARLKWRKDKKYVEEKEKLLEEICGVFRNANLNYINNMLNEIRDALIANGYRVKVCRIRAMSRVLVGVNEDFGKIPFEVGLSFDPILNVPLIPGSSLKGAFRHALYELAMRYVASKNDVEKIVNVIFGSERGAGLVGVTDAYPARVGINDLLFEPDVITPHYQSVKTELDVSPNPVVFLTIARNVEFQFYVFYNKEIYKLEHNYVRRIREKAAREYDKVGVVDKLETSSKHSKDFIKYALYEGDLEEALKGVHDVRTATELIPWVDRAILYAFAKGVGAKTNVGYSRFMVVEYKRVSL